MLLRRSFLSGSSWANFRRLRVAATPIQVQQTRSYILGIETTCDDTGAAVVDLEGRLLGESLHSQQSPRFGGVIPSFAMGWHAQKVPGVVQAALDQAGIEYEQLTAIAVSNRPGLKGSLVMGTDYAKYLSIKYQKPVIPIHHMQAHALTARMEEDVPFPFMVLLVSGGHCILAVARGVADFIRLGESMDSSPGELLDKTARMLRLHLLRTDLRDASGGRAIETLAAEGGDAALCPFPRQLLNNRDCNFSFSGLKSTALRKIEENEAEFKIGPGEMLPNANHICAGLQTSIKSHLCMRLQRALIYAETKGLWGNEENVNFKKSLVVSGGVASNQDIRSGLSQVCTAYRVNLVCPPPRLCTDNGVMIAWNGLERWREIQKYGLAAAEDRGELFPPERAFEMNCFARSKLGEDVSEAVFSMGIKCKWLKIK